MGSASIWIGKSRDSLLSVVHSQKKRLVEITFGKLFDFNACCRPQRASCKLHKLVDIKVYPAPG